MAKITATAGFGALSDYSELDIEVDSTEVGPQFIPAVTQEVKVVLDDGTVALDPETGAELHKVEVVKAGYIETLEQALHRTLRENVTVDEVEKAGLDYLSITVNYTITGSVDLEFDDYELEDFEFGPDDIDVRVIEEAFEDAIRDAVTEDVSEYGVDVEMDIDINEAN
jgi:hypothetical protein